MHLDKTLFEKNFQGHPLPAAFEKLVEAYQKANYFPPEGFELYENDENSGIQAGWTDDEEALSCLFSFAQANHSGSFYALWKQHDGQSTDDMPVILFGDEGGTVVVAENAQSFLPLLGYYGEPYIGSLPKSERGKYPFGKESVEYADAAEEEIDEEILPKYKAFQAWLSRETGIVSPTAEQAKQRVLAAQIKLQEAFNDWMDDVPKLW